MVARVAGFLVLAGLMVGSAELGAVGMFDPGLTWRTLETPNFSIHYHEGEEELAQEAGRIAEDVHQALSPLMRWKPASKTQVVLTDNVDFANGMATPFPVNTMVLFASGPAGAEIDPYEDWLRELITHEYTHVLHLDQVGGIWRLLRATFGRIVLPNVLQPTWLIEGYAVHNESIHTSGGRGRGAAFDMMLRVATLEGRLNSLDQAGASISSWPGGATPYLYGGMFYGWLAERYGEEKLAAVSRLTSAGVPLLVDLPAMVVYGRPWCVLWEEWVDHLEEKSEEERQVIGSRALTASTPLTYRGYYTSSPAFSPQGDRIAYVEYNADEYPCLRLLEPKPGRAGRKPTALENHVPILRSVWLDRTEERALVRGIVNPGLSFSPDGEAIAFSQRETYRNYYTYDDLYVLNLSTGKSERLTYGVRARDPHFSPDGKKIVFVVNKLGRNDLAVMSRDASHLRYLTRNKDHIQYSLPRFSPDGTRIAVSVWRKAYIQEVVLEDGSEAPMGSPLREGGGYQDICIIHVDDPDSQISITCDRAVDLAPSWSPDGKWLLFSSDRSGVHNIYAYSVVLGQLYQVTNVLGGAFSPTLSQDGKWMAFVSYGVNGYDIHLMEFEPEKWWKAEPYIDELPRIAREASEVEFSSHPYNPLVSLLPRFWFPVLAADEAGLGIGFLTLGWDVLQQHQFLLSASYGLRSSRPAFDFSYFNSMLWAEAGLHASDGAASMIMNSGSQGDTTYWERRQRGRLEMTLPFLRTSSRQAISLAYQVERLSSLNELPLDVSKPGTGMLSGVGVRWTYGNSKFYRFGVSPTEGRQISVAIHRDDEQFSSDFNLTRISFDWREYLAIPFLRHNVLAGRLAGAVAVGDTLVQKFYQLGFRSEFSLRGYSQGRFRGQRVVSGSLEYRFPLLWVDRGPITLPFFLRDFQGNIFADWGEAWDGEGVPPLEEWKVGVGGELGSSFDLGWLLSLLVKMGYARGLDEEGESQVYLSLGRSF